MRGLSGMDEYERYIAQLDADARAKVEALSDSWVLVPSAVFSAYEDIAWADQEGLAGMHATEIVNAWQRLPHGAPTVWVVTATDSRSPLENVDLIGVFATHQHAITAERGYSKPYMNTLITEVHLDEPSVTDISQ